jgi:hypothetical protein
MPFPIGGKARLDESGLLFLRSLCKLTHVGHAQYYKGDGHAFADFLKKEYHTLANKCVDRAEHSKRQDWSLEASYNIFPLMEPLIDYTVRTDTLGQTKYSQGHNTYASRVSASRSICAHKHYNVARCI